MKPNSHGDDTGSAPPEEFADADEPGENAAIGAVSIDLVNEQSALPIDEALLRRTVGSIIEDSRFSAAVISIAVLDDPTIHKLNMEFLGHDYPADVLSFVLEASDETLEGEILVSADTAIRVAPEYGWSAAEELTLYVIHGALHLVGYDDRDDEERTEMRTAEARYLARLGITVPPVPREHQ